MQIWLPECSFQAANIRSGSGSGRQQADYEILDTSAYILVKIFNDTYGNKYLLMQPRMIPVWIDPPLNFHFRTQISTLEYKSAKEEAISTSSMNS